MHELYVDYCAKCGHEHVYMSGYPCSKCSGTKFRRKPKSPTRFISRQRRTPMTDKEKAIAKFDADIVEEAESYYETDFGKNFWSDLDDEERVGYFYRAQHVLNRAATKREWPDIIKQAQFKLDLVMQSLSKRIDAYLTLGMYTQSTQMGELLAHVRESNKLIDEVVKQIEIKEP